MEIYSPPLRKAEPKLTNEVRPRKGKNLPSGNRNYFMPQDPGKREPEPVSEWIKRVFYERLRAFFEYEESNEKV